MLAISLGQFFAHFGAILKKWTRKSGDGIMKKGCVHNEKISELQRRIQAKYRKFVPEWKTDRGNSERIWHVVVSIL